MFVFSSKKALHLHIRLLDCRFCICSVRRSLPILAIYHSEQHKSVCYTINYLGSLLLILWSVCLIFKIWFITFLPSGKNFHIYWWNHVFTKMYEHRSHTLIITKTVWEANLSSDQCLYQKVFPCPQALSIWWLIKSCLKNPQTYSRRLSCRLIVSQIKNSSSSHNELFQESLINLNTRMIWPAACPRILSPEKGLGLKRWKYIYQVDKVHTDYRFHSHLLVWW